jgi:DNA-directed RNA polymerase specialized sigma24 family protein
VAVPAVANRLEVATHHPAGTSAFELRDWMSHLDAHERDLMLLQFAEQSKYHEIASAGTTPTLWSRAVERLRAIAVISAKDGQK